MTGKRDKIGTISGTLQRYDCRDNHNCGSSFVEFRDRNSGQHIGQERHYCGHETPPDFFSLGSEAQVIVQIDSTQKDKYPPKFEATYKAELCDRTHYEENGIVHSPRLPDNRYPQNADCTIKLRTAKQHQLQIYFNSFDLESSENCANDFVKVGNGQKLCGNKLPDPVFPKSEKVDIIFHSNDYWEGFGFSLSYVSNFAGCGGLITGYGGNIYSTDYPKAYGDDLNCEWQIVAPSENTPIKLDFKNIAIFSDSDGCFKDEALEIYSGTVDEPQQQLIDNACGVSGQFIQIHYIYDCNVFFMN